MTAPSTPPHQVIAALDLSAATDKQIAAIQKRADRDGVFFDDAALAMLLELADREEKNAAPSIAARLFRFPCVSRWGTSQ
ncbi:MAG: hypothetical protein LBJ15_19520 [Comamonas sp.]|jgi:hypothetical protein|uniref:hypothetical protein n=1 Tax=Comamonas sp. TaxID=34028 RepID=UPI00283865FE|nr:hypothetical protein [Comamonas sp.]MDR0216165.1 hypothetical protein [Comamonas sp.]